MEKIEFDKYADEYERLLKNATKSFGENVEFFAEYKVQDTKELVEKLNISDSIIMDFGSGIGNSIPFFRKYFTSSKLICADPSTKSLELSKKRFPGSEEYSIITSDKIMMADNCVDLVFTTCVFHHIPHFEHDLWLKEINRVLKPGGMLVIFEHNPLNPLTRRTVNQCEFDENAVLIKERDFKAKLQNLGFNEVGSAFRLFFPNTLKFLRGFEKYLKVIPMGAQYYVYGIK